MTRPSGDTALVAARGRLAADPDRAALLREIAVLRQAADRVYLEIIGGIDTAVRENWPMLIAFFLDAGVSDEDILREVGASVSTVYRWQNNAVAPREGTRKLIKSALLSLLRERLSVTGSGFPGPSPI